MYVYAYEYFNNKTFYHCAYYDISKALTFKLSDYEFSSFLPFDFENYGFTLCIVIVLVVKFLRSQTHVL